MFEIPLNNSKSRAHHRYNVYTTGCIATDGQDSVLFIKPDDKTAD